MKYDNPYVDSFHYNLWYCKNVKDIKEQYTQYNKNYWIKLQISCVANKVYIIVVVRITWYILLIKFH